MGGCSKGVPTTYRIWLRNEKIYFCNALLIKACFHLVLNVLVCILITIPQVAMGCYMIVAFIGHTY